MTWGEWLESDYEKYDKNYGTWEKIGNYVGVRGDPLNFYIYANLAASDSKQVEVTDAIDPDMEYSVIMI